MGERGLTIPRLRALADSWQRHRLRELQEQGNVTALAVNDPKQLAEVFADRPPDAGEQGRGWDNDD